jgi:UDPglucose 6-dehydrogenase
VPAVTRVAVFGIWHLGAVTAACLAHLGLRVTGVEADASRLAALIAGAPPLHEPGLAEMMGEEIAAGRLGFVADLKSATAEADVVIFAEDVPVNDADEPDVSGLLQTARTVAPYLRDDTTVVVMSQVPVGTCALIQRTVMEARLGSKIEVAYCPENLRMGAAIERFLMPDMVVIGADSPRARGCAERLYAGIPGPKVTMDVRSAEMTKHALNALLATATSFGNELATLCEYLDVDATQVIEAIRMDKRIGYGLPLLPGPPFSGGTLARDLQVLRRLASSNGIPVPLLDGVTAVNETQKRLAVRRLEDALGDLSGKRIAILGLTYKSGTSTIRRSTAVELIQVLTERRADVAAYDPKAEFPPAARLPRFERAADAYAAARGADAVVIMTDWPEFRALDMRTLRAVMRGSVLIDIRNILDAGGAVDAGLAYYGVGRRGR